MSKYKYNININQTAIIENNLDIDFNDVAIFEMIKDFMFSDSCLKIEINGDRFFWISHQHVIDQLPALGIKSKSGIYKRIEKLIKAGLLCKKPYTNGDSKTYYKVGPKYDDFIFSKEPREASNKNNETPSQMGDPPLPNGRPPSPKWENNNINTIYNNTTYKEKSDKLKFADDSLFSEEIDKGIFDNQQKKEKEKKPAPKKEKELKDRELLKIQDHEVPDKELEYFKIARSFQDLFISNLEENGSITTNQKKAKYGNYVRPIRLMMEKDGVTLDQFRNLFKFLKVSDFWKSNILSTDKLRKQSSKLLIQFREHEKRSQSTGNSAQQEQREYYQGLMQGIFDKYRS